MPEPARRPATRFRGTVGLVAAIAALALGLVTTSPAIAGDPRGDWLTKDRDAKVRVADCDGGLCGTVVWLKDAIDPATGKPVADKHNVDQPSAPVRSWVSRSSST